ncbi:hypothetical protein HanXRQr2_Chr10g0455051 [Helianthus annuus]|uniref:Uncharacterized protein n=1 Tax=Helianthus annuus TaxID=4232 RepID=A0A9K3N5C4_HELAN|nr:hypothetical protein HanXRQr2_Chr10g0455051 [Helianthus annuus]KAJ0514844.1 hypothetical protein HanHA300_Chr10g0374121 [Helianthus annuus]KAJ0531008.1 hypothetical protein HanHA89_Chr10g0396341 [Helianthus annuus]KAJ0697858.1 hypothetical protein HanLR1_Chr10g0373731 [Helianthus annuus]KAJ0884925.1 hypothetical protein HanPSC8_Chr10g0439451 [Helianthus annuus]
MVENNGYFDVGECGDCGGEIFEKKQHEGFLIPTSISNKFSRIELEETVAEEVLDEPEPFSERGDGGQRMDR